MCFNAQSDAKFNAIMDAGDHVLIVRKMWGQYVYRMDEVGVEILQRVGGATRIQV